MTSPYGRDKLSYPWSYRTLLEQDDNRVFVSGDPSQTTECTWYVLQVTSEERLKLWSALLAGLDLLYPDNFIELSQIWLQATEFPNDFPPQNGDCTVNLCALIQQCIETTPELQQLISSLSNAPTTSLDATESTENLSALIADFGTNCNSDNLFGAITGLVDLLDAVSQDLLEILSASANPSARIGDLIEAVPIIGELFADDILQMLESVLTDIEQGYNSAWTVSLRNEIRCDLFCLCQESCSLDMEDIRDYYYGKLGETLTFSSLEEFLLEFLVLNVTGTATVYAMHYFIVQMLILSAKITGIDILHLQKVVASLFNDPDSDWVTLCTTCPEVPIVFFSDGNGYDSRWNPTYGSYNSTEDDWDGADVGATITARGFVQLPAGAHLTSVTFDYRSKTHGSRTCQFGYGDIPFGASYTLLESVTVPSNQDTRGTLTWTGDIATDKVGFSADADDEAGDISQIEGIRIEYYL